MKFGIIGGTGLSDLDWLEDARPLKHSSRPQGSDCHTYGKIDKHEVAFINRHCGGRAPHRVPYKKWMSILRENEVDLIVGITACGSLRQFLEPGTFQVPDDFWDMTGRHETFIDDQIHPIAADPYNWSLKECLRRAFGVPKMAHSQKIVSIPGPRFATRVESEFYAQYADLINMTTATESSLALEISIPYAVLAFVTDYDQGAAYGTFQPKPATYEMIKERFEDAVVQIRANLPDALSVLAAAVEDKND